MSNLIGKILGPYQIIHKVHETPTKAVYKAYHTQLERNVALEIILPSKIKPQNLFNLLKDHAKNIAKLSHPNIPPLLDCSEYDNEICLAFDFDPIGILRKRFNQNFSYQQAASLLIPICHSLSYAHQQEIIHGNIAPNNIYQNQDRTLVIFDFGIDLIISQELIKNSPGNWLNIGISKYTAPEQLISKQIDQRVDIYSLGMVFCELVIGQTVQVCNSPLEELSAHLSNNISIPQKHAKEMPDSVKKILKEILAKNPNDRLNDMQIITMFFSKIALGIPVTNSEISNTTKNDPGEKTLWNKFVLKLLVLLSILVFFFFQLFPEIFHESNISETVPQLETTEPAQLLSPQTPNLPVIKETIIPTVVPVQVNQVDERIPALSGEPLPSIHEPLSSTNLQRMIQLGKWGIGRVNDASLSNDGNNIALATSLGVFVYDTQTNLLQKYFNPGVPVRSVIFSHSGKYIATGEENGLIHIWSLIDSTTIKNLPGHLKAVNTIKFSPDDNLLASGSDDQSIIIWDLSLSKPIKELKKHTREIQCLDFSPDGTLLATGAPDFSVKVWEVSTGELKKEISQSTMTNVVSFSKDGKIIFSGGENGIIELWDVESGSRIKGFSGLLSPVTSISVFSNMSNIAAGDTSGNIVVWDANGKQIWKSKNKRNERILESSFNYSNIVLFSLDKNAIYSVVWDGTIRNYDTRTGTEKILLDTISDFIVKISISPDSKYLVSQTADNKVIVWDLYTGRKLYKWDGSIVTGNVISNDSKYLAIRLNASTAKIYDLTNGKELWTYYGHKNIQGMSFSSNDFIIAIGNKNEIKIWSLSSGQEIITVNDSVFNGCSLANNFAYATHYDLISFSRSICRFQKVGWMTSLGYSNDYVVKAVGGASKLEYEGNDMEGLTGYTVKNIAISTDGSLIAASMDDFSIRIWDTSGKELMRLLGHDHPITSLLFTQDNNLLISSSMDGTIQIWGIH